MTVTEPTSMAAAATRPGVTTLTVAAWASLGAGAVHAAAIGVHADARQTALLFTAVAAFQLGWGVVALAVQNRLVAVIGAIGSAALVAGWLLSFTSGIGFVDGLEDPASAQIADSFAAVLAASVALLCGAALTRRPAASWHPVGRLASLVGVLAVVGLAVPGLVSASEHDHGDHGSRAAGHEDDDHHDHEDESVVAQAVTDHGDDHHTGEPKPYDPEMPIDLGGVEGVTPQQQAAAENLVAVTLLRLPKYADPAVAKASGFHSIGDGSTGHEHYVNWDHIDDGRILDPDYPESLVYETRDGEKTLVAAMYMLGSGATLDDVPELGGSLTQWHVHNDLCFSDGPAPQVRGLTTPGGECAPPLVKGAAVPMIHVWTVPHRCGPFAALDGVGGGQIAEGEERLCDHAHGA